MIYFITFLIILGGWQALANGRFSKLISWLSFCMALFVVIFGLVIKEISFGYLLFIAFNFGSLIILMQVYRLSTYHRYFFVMLPVLMIFAAFIGFLLFFSFNQFYISYVVLSISYLIIDFNRQLKTKEILKTIENEEDKMFYNSSINKTLKYYVLSSAVFLVSVIVSLLFFYNK